MRLDELFRAFGQAFGEAVSENGKFRFDFDGGKWAGNWDKGGWEAEDWDELDALDLEDAAPDVLKVALARGDTVRVKKGKKLAIKVEGDEADSLRFKLADDALRIMRGRGSKGKAGGELLVKVTMPAPRKIAIGGAGNVESETLADEGQVAIGGSGSISLDKLSGDILVAKIGGSGRIEAKGSVDRLELSIGGSGKFVAPELEVEHAEIRIGGSGKAEFASDGEVEAKIGGVGDIVVHGQPRCSLKAGGAGRIRCVPRGENGNGGDAEVIEAA